MNVPRFRSLNRAAESVPKRKRQRPGFPRNEKARALLFVPSFAFDKDDPAPFETTPRLSFSYNPHNRSSALFALKLLAGKLFPGVAIIL